MDTLSAWTRMMLLSVPQRELPVQGFGLESAGRMVVVVAPAPTSDSGLSTTMFSMYVPAPTEMVSPELAASTAA
jgi:hypothetical protein